MNNFGVDLPQCVVTMPHEGNSCWILLSLECWLNLSWRIPMAPSSSLKKSLTIFIPSLLETSLKQSDLARCKPGQRGLANLTLAAILDFTQATLRALNDLF